MRECQFYGPTVFCVCNRYPVASQVHRSPFFSDCVCSRRFETLRLFSFLAKITEITCSLTIYWGFFFSLFQFFQFDRWLLRFRISEYIRLLFGHFSLGVVLVKGWHWFLRRRIFWLKCVSFSLELHSTLLCDLGKWHVLAWRVLYLQFWQPATR